MKHYGDITKLNGAELPVVDCITGGSPCQDLSVAGLRKGLLHSGKGDEETTRSGLFMEQLRIIKEMRENERKNGRVPKPRFMVWENVPGAFSSNDGEDFRVVLEETARVADPTATIPRPTEGWSPSGCILASGWSLGWRVHDAQFWGVAQRRKRISLVADFGGESAPEILFEREGMSGNSESSRETGEGAPTRTSECVDGTSRVEIEDFIDAVNAEAIHQQDLIQSDLGVSRTLAPGTHASGSHLTKTLITSNADNDFVFQQNQREECRIMNSAGSITSESGMHNQNFVVSYGVDGYNGAIDEESTSTLGVNCSMSTGRNGVMTYSKSRRAKDPEDYTTWVESETANTLNTFDLGETRTNELVYCLQGNGIDRADTAGCNGKGWKEDVSYTLNTIDRPAVAYEPHRKAYLANGEEVTGCLTASGYDKLGAQEMMSGAYTVIEERPIQSFSQDSFYEFSESPVSSALRHSGGPAGYGGNAIIVESYGVTSKGNGDAFLNPETATSITTGGGQAGQGYPCVLQAVGVDRYNQTTTGEVSSTIKTPVGGDDIPCVMSLETYHCSVEEETSQTLKARDYKDPICVVQPMGVDVYNQSVTGEVSKCLTNVSSDSDHIPCVMQAVENKDVLAFEPGIASRKGGHVYPNVSGTLRAEPGDNRMAVVYGIDQQGGKGNANYTEDVSPTLLSESHGTPNAVAYGFDPTDTIAYNIDSEHSNSMKSDNPNSGFHETSVAKTLDTSSQNPSRQQGGTVLVQDAFSVENHPADSRVEIREDGTVQTLTSRMGTGGGNVPLVVEPTTIEGSSISPTLIRGQAKQNGNTQDGLTVVTYSEEKEQDRPLYAPIVRRLTPTECERLQGYPDGWTKLESWVDTKGKVHKDSDSARYKALGNSIALPFWDWLLGRIVNQYNRTATLGSLFDGIGGFPYCWEKHAGKGTALWASEIEEFPIAVTKVHFPEVDFETFDWWTEYTDAISNETEEPKVESVLPSSPTKHKLF